MAGTDDALRRQEELYGQPLAAVVAHISRTLRLNQGQVAETIGLSAPMMSQLVGGHRVKIGNPVVGARFTALAALADDVDAGRCPADELPSAIERVRTDEMRPHTTRTGGPTGESTDPSTGVRSAADEDAVARRVQAMFRSVASAGDHLEAASSLEAEHPAVAELLRVYGAGRTDEAEEHLRRHE